MHNLWYLPELINSPFFAAHAAFIAADSLLA